MPKKTSTDLVLIAGQGALKKTDATAADVMSAMHAAELTLVKGAMAAHAPIPKQISPSVEQEKAVSTFLEAVEMATFPNEIRKLTPMELEDLTHLRELTDHVEDLVDATKESIRDAVMNHFDEVAVEAGLVDSSTYKTKDHHYVIKDRKSGAIAGLAKKFVRTVRRGKVTFGTPVELDDFVLDLFERKIIDRKTYLRWTRAVRIVDTEKMFKDMKDPRLMKIIRQATRVTAPTAALEITNNDGEDD